MKVIRVKNHITVILDNGTMLTNSNCTDELYNNVMVNQNDEEQVQCLLVPEFCKKKEEIEIKTRMLTDFTASKYLSVFGNSVYIKSVSELTVPEDLAVALFKAEQDQDTELVQTYLNFWTLCSLNPDSRARTNLFWFLKRYGMTISKSGLFVAYRNVQLKSEGKQIKSYLANFVSNQYSRVKYKLKKSPKNYFVGYQVDLTEDNLIVHFDKAKFKQILGKLDELYANLSDEQVAPVYTDAHTRTFTIKIGEPVTIDRSKCDADSSVTCSKGLHLGGKSWLEEGYFGDTTLLCLVNPSDVVAIPEIDSYGKMRVCAYYPVQIVNRDEDGKIIDQVIDDGFEDDFMHHIAYSGDINNTDIVNYTVDIPEIPEISKKKILNRLVEISNSLNKKYVD
jgi:hypothetical protein